MPEPVPSEQQSQRQQLQKKQPKNAADGGDDDGEKKLESESESKVKKTGMDAHIENRAFHEGFMREAIGMAELALRSDETPVGCVFVHDGKVVGRGMNDTNRSLNGTAHCEFIAIRQILADHPASFLQQCDLYVTVEPCIMCAAMLRQFRIRSVYFGCANERFGGTGGVINVHSDPCVDPGYPVYGGMFREEAIMLLRRFYVQENDKAPEPHKKANRELKTEIVAHKGKANKCAT